MLVPLLILLSIPQVSPAETAASRLQATSNQPALLGEILASHPALAHHRRIADAEAARASGAGTLPDPEASAQVFLLPPETRVGPQRLTLSARQRLPWRGQRRLHVEAAQHRVTAAQRDIESAALAIITQARRSLIEIAFLDAQDAILEEERLHLLRHEEAARARYAAGNGPQQAAVRLQSAVTGRDRDRLVLARRRAALVAEVNALRAAPAVRPFDVSSIASLSDAPPDLDTRLDSDALLAVALGARPEMRAHEARIDHHRTAVRIAERGDRPDVTVGLGYTVVESREDLAGRLMPPEGNGDDILGINVSVALPVRKRRIAAALLSQQEMLAAAEAARDVTINEIRRQLGDAVSRLPLVADEHRLLTGVLAAQADEAWRSAEIGYSTGELDALDLLDAEHMLFEVRTASARAAADHAILLVELEGALGLELTAALSRLDSSSTPTPPETSHGY